MRNESALRAIVALAVGLFVSFSGFAITGAEWIGLWALAGFGISNAVLLVLSSILLMRAENRLNPESIPLAVISLLIGLLALFAASGEGSAAFAAFSSLVMAWGVLAGAFELYAARRLGFQSREGRDSAITAGFSLVLALLFLLTAPDAVTASGYFGMYLMLTGIFLGIAAVGKKA